MAGAFLVTLREGLEAALIISIILAYLARTGNRGYFVNVWIGAGAAVVLSLMAGAGLYWTVGRLSGRTEEIFEGIAMLIAVAVLTYMVIWMKRQAVNIKAHLEVQVGSALAKGSALAMVGLAFVVVVREGIETVLFMLGILNSTTPTEATIGGLLGLAIALGIGYAGYKGSRRLNLGVFFNVTGALLIFFAAGLLAYGIHELQEAGVFPVIIEHVWDMNGFLNENEGFGNFIRTLFGYNGNPSLLEVSLYSTYLVVALTYFFGVGRSTSQKIASPPAGIPARISDQDEHLEM